MSIEKPKILGTSDPHIDAQMEQKKFLRTALQESYELNLSNSFRKEKIENIERISQDKGIDLDSNAIQIAHNALIEYGNLYSVSELEKFALNKGIQLTPDVNSLQSVYVKSLEKGNDFVTKELEQYAQENGIELIFNKDALQRGYDKELENYYDSSVKKLEQYAQKNGIEMEVKEELLQKAYDKKLSEVKNLDQLENIEQLAQREDIKLEVDKDIIQNAYEKAFEVYINNNNDKGLKIILDLCNKRGFEVSINNKRVQELYEEKLKYGNEEGISSLQNYADEKGISLDISNFDPQEFYNNYISKGNLYSAEKVKKFAEKNSYEIKKPSKEVLQQGYNAEMFSEHLHSLSKIEELAKENGIEVEVKKDVLQKAFEKVCTGNLEHHNLNQIEKLEELAKENGIELENAKDLMEKTYIESIHNVRLGHADIARWGIQSKCGDLGSDLTYEDVIKMDYLEYLKVPEEQRLNIENTVQVGEAPMTARFYGQKKETPVQGKFIIGITPENTLEFVSDSTLGEHRDIAGKYSLKIIGGGWLEIDEPNKKVKIYGSSQDFGYEPRSISKKVIEDTFSDYEITVEN